MSDECFFHLQHDENTLPIDKMVVIYVLYHRPTYWFDFCTTSLGEKNSPQTDMSLPMISDTLNPESDSNGFCFYWM